MALSGQVKLNDELHEIDGKPIGSLSPPQVESRNKLSWPARTNLLACALPGDGPGERIRDTGLADRPQDSNSAEQVAPLRKARLGPAILRSVQPVDDF